MAFFETARWLHNCVAWLVIAMLFPLLQLPTQVALKSAQILWLSALPYFFESWLLGWCCTSGRAHDFARERAFA
eukprot:472114-Pyramimonas_sp.AAC.1